MVYKLWLPISVSRPPLRDPAPWANRPMVGCYGNARRTQRRPSSGTGTFGRGPCCAASVSFGPLGCGAGRRLHACPPECGSLGSHASRRGPVTVLAGLPGCRAGAPCRGAGEPPAAHRGMCHAASGRVARLVRRRLGRRRAPALRLGPRQGPRHPPRGRGLAGPGYARGLGPPRRLSAGFWLMVND